MLLLANLAEKNLLGIKYFRINFAVSVLLLLVGHHE